MDFFEQQTEASALKAAIVEKYFRAWAKIIAHQKGKLGYIDLYSGPGIYEDGKESTPILILKAALSMSRIAEKLHVFFNDANQEAINRLQQHVNQLPGITRLSDRISYSSQAIGSDITSELKSINLIPSFSFIDPFGYSGVTKDLIISLTQAYACDCIFFLNYSRINAGISNDKVRPHMEALFGRDIQSLRDEIKHLTPKDREEVIIEVLAKSFERINGKKSFVLPFRFCRPPGCRGTQTSHYLVFLSKHFLGYKIMKEIMHSAGSVDEENIGTFEYIPSQNSQLKLLFGYRETITDLENRLCQQYRGKTYSVEELFYLDSYGTPFILSNYKDALRNLEEQKRIYCDPSVRRFRKGIKTMADDTKITFPS